MKGSFRNLLVWEKAHKLVLLIYEISGNFPQSEQYGINSQLRRAAVSVPTNIVEGYKRTGNLDKIRFFNIAQSSLEETRYLLILSKDLEYSVPEDAFILAEEVSKMLETYIQKMKENTLKEPDSEY
jgi:four helix bundle protein